MEALPGFLDVRDLVEISYMEEAAIEEDEEGSKEKEEGDLIHHLAKNR